MSKLQLKKILMTMDADDLRALVLQTYDARKEAKEFLDFFANPDIDKKLEKTTEALNKELTRKSRHRFACRVSRLKAELKRFATYGPEDEMLLSLWVKVFRALAVCAGRYYCSPTFHTSSASLLKDLLKLLDEKNQFSTYFPDIQQIIDNLDANDYDSREFRYAATSVIHEHAARIPH